MSVSPFLHVAFLGKCLRARYGIPRDVFYNMVWVWVPPAPYGRHPIKMMPIKWIELSDGDSIEVFSYAEREPLYRKWITLKNCDLGTHDILYDCTFVLDSDNNTMCTMCDKHITWHMGRCYAELNGNAMWYNICRANDISAAILDQ